MNLEKKKMLTEIFDIVTEINGEEENKKGDLCVFLNISPHVSAIEIDVHPKGWVLGESGETYRAKIDLDVNESLYSEISLAEMLQRVKALKSVTIAEEMRNDRAS
ncbi:hypothetical protein [Eubacterium maltosivorans]|uniref:hypothetical protein n=1 Tax=Eubacterium maltosivorans TaxID=2041044 RepID=UPI00189E687E|nr:hypothetical protein [Eubacterium maltosivorans]